MSQKKAIHFGGGNIGRGFVAEFLHKSGYEVVFVDVVDALIDRIKSTSSYKVKEVGSESTEEFEITNYRAINSKHEESKVVNEIASADIVTCAVGPNILKFIAPVIAKGIDKRHQKETPLAVIACENAIGATDTLKGFIVDKLEETSEGLLADKARFANSAVDRIVPVQENPDSLDVVIEKFYEWCVDKSPFKDIGHPKIEGVHFVDDLIPYIERKLFTVNTGHACSAYHGHKAGKKYIHEVLADDKLKAIVQETLAETSKLIVNKHGITESDQKAYVDSIITRISNPLLKDGVERVGRAPLRKLSRKERFIAPAAELAERGEKIEGLLGCIEHALYFQNVEGDDESRELAKILNEMNAADATEKLTGLHKDHPLYGPVEQVIAKVQKAT